MSPVDHVLAASLQAGLTQDERETVARLLVSTDRPQAAHADLGLGELSTVVGGDVG